MWWALLTEEKTESQAHTAQGHTAEEWQMRLKPVPALSHHTTSRVFL